MRLPAAAPALLLLQHLKAAPEPAAALLARAAASQAPGWLGPWQASLHAGPSTTAAAAVRPVCTSATAGSADQAASSVPESTSAAAAKLTTLGARGTRSGYPESRPASYSQAERAGGHKAAAARDADLQQASQQQHGERPVDYYKLVRVLFADGGEQKAGGVQLDKEAVVVLNKLVGALTKEGKRSKANRILLDALHLIRESAAKERAA